MRETPDQAATRRRWISLAELVAVAGVIIAALTLWNSWSERRSDEAQRHAEQASAAKAHGLARLTGTVSGNGDTITVSDPDHRIDTIDVRFPAALGAENHQDVASPRIEKGWFSAPLLKATDGGPDRQEGQLPVLITANWWDGDTHRTDRGIYDIAWQTHGRRLFGRALKMEALVLRERGGSAKRLDSLWRAPAR